MTVAISSFLTSIVKKWISLLLFYLAILISHFSIAQSIYANRGTRHSLSFSTGICQPVGNWGVNDFSNSASGFAQTGWQSQLTYHQSLRSGYGIFTSFVYQQNPINKQYMEQALGKTNFIGTFYAGSYPMPQGVPIISGNLYQQWQVEHASWKSFSFLAGADKQWALGEKEKWLLIVQTGAGLTHATSPVLNASGYTDTTSAYLTQNSGVGWGFIGKWGGNISYPLSKKWRLYLQADYFFTGAISYNDITMKVIEIKGDINLPPNNISQYQSTGSIVQRISSFCLTTGISFLF